MARGVVPPFVVPRFYDREMPRAIRRGRGAHGVWREMTHLLGKHLLLGRFWGMAGMSLTRVSQMIWPQFGHNLQCFVPCAKGVAPTAHMPMARAKIKKECSKHVMLSFVTLIVADRFSWVYRCACVAFCFCLICCVLASGSRKHSAEGECQWKCGPKHFQRSRSLRFGQGFPSVTGNMFASGECLIYLVHVSSERRHFQCGVEII